MILAAKEGAGYSYSLFHVPDCSEGPATIRQYYDTFFPSAEFPTASASLAVTTICAETEADSQRYANWLQSEKFGIPINVHGDAGQCREQIISLCERYGVDECIIVPLWAHHEQRVLSLKLLADAFALDQVYR